MAASAGSSQPLLHPLSPHAQGSTSPYVSAPSSGRRPRSRVPEDLRKRSARACTECRRKKEKCDGQSSCGRCTRRHLLCQYDPLMSRPRVPAVDLGSRPGHSSSSSLSTEERYQYMEKIFTHCLVGRRLGDDELRDLANSIPDKSPRDDRNHDRTHISAMDDGMETTKAESEIPVRPVVSGSSSEEKTEKPCEEDLSLHKFTHRLASAIEEKEELDTRQVEQTVSDGADQTYRARIRLPGSRRLSQRLSTRRSQPHTFPCDDPVRMAALGAALNAFPPREITLFLLEVFFRYTQTSLFYVEEAWVYRFVDGCYTDSPGSTSSPQSTPRSATSLSSASVDDIPSVCTVLLVMACGTQFAHMAAFKPEEANHGGKNSSEDENESPHMFEDGTARHFYEAALRLLPYIIAFNGPSSTPSLHSVQACLMLATYNFSLDSMGASYTYLSLAMTLSVQMGLHEGRGLDTMDEIQAEVHRRIWWTTYILHVQVSIKYGRPVFLSYHWGGTPASTPLPSPITVDKPSDLPPLRPMAQSEPPLFSNQSRLIELMLATEAISDEISRLRTTNRAVHFLNLLGIRQKLVQWWSDSGAAIDSFRSIEKFARDPPSTGVEMRRLRNDIHVRLYYWNTLLSLGRPFLLLRPNNVNTPKASTSTTLGKDTLIQDALIAALEIVRLCQLLRDGVGLARASYATEFTCCRTAMLVLLAHGLVRGLGAVHVESRPQSPLLSATEPQTIRDSLSRGLTILKSMAAGGSVLAQSEARDIEALERAVDQIEAAIERRRQWELKRAAAEAQAAAVADAYVDTMTGVESTSGGQVQNDGPVQEPKKSVDYGTFRTWSRLWQPSSMATTPPEITQTVNSNDPSPTMEVTDSVVTTAPDFYYRHEQGAIMCSAPVPSFQSTSYMPSISIPVDVSGAMSLDTAAAESSSFLGSLPQELSQFDIMASFDPSEFDFSDMISGDTTFTTF